MKLHRINALLFRHLYLYKRSVPRLMDIFYWPIMELLVWGFLSFYLQKIHAASFNVVTVLLGAIIFWDIFTRSQGAVSVAFLEDVWEKNFLNIFVTPLTLGEFLASTFLLGIVRIILVGITACVLAFFAYHFNIFQFGLYLVPFLMNLFFFGWVLGLLTIAIILRFGTSAQVLAFGIAMLLQPFSAVFYPVSALPAALQPLSYALPVTYIFEGMRAVAETGGMPFSLFAWATGLNLVYFILMAFLLYRMFAYVKRKGLLLKLD